MSYAYDPGPGFPDCIVYSIIPRCIFNNMFYESWNCILNCIKCNKYLSPESRHINWFINSSPPCNKLALISSKHEHAENMYYAGWNCMLWPIFRVCAFYLNMHVKTPAEWHAEREIQIFQMLIMGWFLKFRFFSVRKYLWNNLRKFWNARDQDSRLEDDDKRIIFLMRSNILHNTSECRLAPWGGPNRDWKMVISNFSKPT